MRIHRGPAILVLHKHGFSISPGFNFYETDKAILYRIYRPIFFSIRSYVQSHMKMVGTNFTKTGSQLQFGMQGAFYIPVIVVAHKTDDQHHQHNKNEYTDIFPHDPKMLVHAEN